MRNKLPIIPSQTQEGTVGRLGCGGRKILDSCHLAVVQLLLTSSNGVTKIFTVDYAPLAFVRVESQACFLNCLHNTEKVGEVVLPGGKKSFLENQ